MKELYVDNYVITEPIINILRKVQSSLINGKLKIIEEKSDEIMVTCPIHKDGKESRPSCYVYQGDGDLPLGAWHCFTCGNSGQLWDFIGACFDKSGDWGKRWLISNFGEAFSETALNLESINLNEVETKTTLDESILEQFESYHPYMTKRGLSDEIIKKFQIMYDPLSKSIVFPVRDLKGNLSFLTRRSTEGKKFYIDKDADKSIPYLLYNIVQENIKEVVVCEGQFDALLSWTYGKPAIAMIGAGTPKEQMDTLNKLDIMHYILCYDNDASGRKGAERFKKLINKRCFVDDIIMPVGKDVGSLTKEEFDNLVYNSL